MHELTPAVAMVCKSNVDWECTIEGSKGATYTVRYGQSYDRHSLYVYDYSCSCPAFLYHRNGSCKHIETAKAKRCGWNEGFDPGIAPDRDTNGNLVCPKCGGPVVPIKVGV